MTVAPDPTPPGAPRIPTDILGLAIALIGIAALTTGVALTFGAGPALMAVGLVLIATGVLIGYQPTDDDNVTPTLNTHPPTGGGS